MLPAYGDDPLVRETISSVLAQSDPRWHLTVVDDGATMTGNELGSWLGGLDDPRVEYVPNPQRLGINRNFQRCADLAQRDWVTILGADDRLLPDFVARVDELTAAHPKIGWIHTGATIIDDAGAPSMPMADRVKKFTMPRIRGSREMAGEELAVSLLRGNWMYFPSCVFRREPLLKQGFRVGYDIVLDLDLYLGMLLNGDGCLLLEKPGIEYRRHAASLSSSGAVDGTRFAEETAYFTEIAAAMSQHRWPRAARAARRHWTSRFHALAKVPSLLVARRFQAAWTISKLAVLPSRTRY